MGMIYHQLKELFRFAYLLSFSPVSCDNITDAADEEVADDMFITASSAYYDLRTKLVVQRGSGGCQTRLIAQENYIINAAEAAASEYQPYITR